MARTIRILCVHGVGNPERNPNWQDEWHGPIIDGLKTWGTDIEPKLYFLEYDKVFERYPLDLKVVGASFSKLLGSLVWHGVGDLFRARGFFEIPERLRWTAGMVAQWADIEKLRKELEAIFLQGMKDSDPHVVLTQSLGSLIAYDALSNKGNEPLMKNRSFVTFGSQVGNPAVRNAFGGRLEALAGARNWYHLFNPSDRVFTAPIKVNAKNFQQVRAEFVSDGIFNHDLDRYLRHPNAIDAMWRGVATAVAPGDGARVMVSKALVETNKAKRKVERRALLVGINDYPDPAARLEGCVNDVFEISATLQDAGFKPEDIRVVLNDRATAAGILERLNWLLEDAKDGDERIFYYSGHGAQIPQYDVFGEPDKQIECLVPYDFDWSLDRAVTDKQFVSLYSDLPYGCRFVMIFDCCHSGGMHREGGRRVRGLTPPDDIRHRELMWDGRNEMWVPRPLKQVNDDSKRWKNRDAFVGANGSKRRFGRATELRETSNKDFDALLKSKGHFGPYLPLIIEACAEEQLSYEYRHGVTSYGAFTYSLTRILRNAGRAGKQVSFSRLVAQVSDLLKEIGYTQTPAILGPGERLKENVPYRPRRARKKEEAPPA